jgi:hypothetical protein
MGMYTHWALQVEFRKDTPEEFLNEIRAVIAREDNDGPLYPINRAGAAYQVCAPPRLTSEFGDQWTLTVLASVKYGTGKIMEAVDYLAPYVETYEPGFCGWMQYEEDDHPTLLYIHDGKVAWEQAARSTVEGGHQ